MPSRGRGHPACVLGATGERVGVLSQRSNPKIMTVLLFNELKGSELMLKKLGQFYEDAKY